jgi:hypothetical protein
VAIGTAVEFMAFSDPDMLASMTKSTQFICLLSADWNGVRKTERQNEQPKADWPGRNDQSVLRLLENYRNETALIICKLVLPSLAA